MLKPRKAICFANGIRLALSLLLLQLIGSFPAHAATDVNGLINYARQIEMQARAAGRGEADFRMALIFDRIVRDYPSSPAATDIRANRALPGTGIDVAAVRARARAWAVQNPAAAQKLLASADETLAPVTVAPRSGARTVPRPPRAVVTDAARPKVAIPKITAPAILPAAPARPTPAPAVTPTRKAGGTGLKLPPKAVVADNSGALSLPSGSNSAADAARNAPGRRTALLSPQVPRNPVGAASPELNVRGDARRLLRRATVLVYFVEYLANGQVRTSPVGTGSFISPTLVLTNAHVAEIGDTRRGTWLVINEEIGVKVAKVSSNARRDTPIQIDAALMEVQGYRHSAYLPLSAGARVDEWIGIAGYPGDAAVLDARYDALAQALIAQRVPERYEIPSALVDEGRLNNIVPDKQKRALTLQYTMITAPGNSGSPIINACGQLIGLHFAGYNTRVKYNIAEHAQQLLIYLRHVNAPHEEVQTGCGAGG